MCIVLDFINCLKVHSREIEEGCERFNGFILYRTSYIPEVSFFIVILIKFFLIEPERYAQQNVSVCEYGGSG